MNSKKNRCMKNRVLQYLTASSVFMGVAILTILSPAVGQCQTYEGCVNDLAHCNKTLGKRFPEGLLFTCTFGNPSCPLGQETCTCRSDGTSRVERGCVNDIAHCHSTVMKRFPEGMSVACTLACPVGQRMCTCRAVVPPK